MAKARMTECGGASKLRRRNMRSDEGIDFARLLHLHHVAGTVEDLGFRAGDCGSVSRWDDAILLAPDDEGGNAARIEPGQLPAARKRAVSESAQRLADAVEALVFKKII